MFQSFVLDLLLYHGDKSAGVDRFIFCLNIFDYIMIIVNTSGIIPFHPSKNNPIRVREEEKGGELRERKTSSVKEECVMRESWKERDRESVTSS